MNRSLKSFLLFSWLWFGLLGAAGTLNSGYHLMDDHGILEISDQFQDKGFLLTLVDKINSDLQIRLRPIYYLHRVSLVYLLGTNFFYLSIYRALLAIITMQLLYLTFINFNLSRFESILIAALALFGYQSVIWFWLGPAEAIGMTLLSLSLYFFSRYYRNREIFENVVISTLALILSGFSKESFLISMPFISIFYLSLLYLKDKFLKNPDIYISLLVILSFILGLTFIFNKLGTNTIGYAGVESSIISFQSLRIISYFFFKEKTLYLPVLGVLLLLITQRNKIRLADFIPIIILVVLILGQFFLYFKSGIRSWYLNPMYLYYALVVALLLPKIQHKPLKVIFTSIVSVFLLLRITLNFWGELENFESDGKKLKRNVDQIQRYTNAHELVYIICDVTSDYEFAPSLATYLTYKYQYDSIGFVLVNKPGNLNPFEKGLYYSFLNEFSDKITETSNVKGCLITLSAYSDSSISSFQTIYQNDQFLIYSNK